MCPRRNLGVRSIARWIVHDRVHKTIDGHCRPELIVAVAHRAAHL